MPLANSLELTTEIHINKSLSDGVTKKINQYEYPELIIVIQFIKFGYFNLSDRGPE